MPPQHSEENLNPRQNAACSKLLEEKDAEIGSLIGEQIFLQQKIATLQVRVDDLMDEISCAADLANTWARERGVEESKSPYSGLELRNLIDRIWAKVSTDPRSVSDTESKLTHEKPYVSEGKAEPSSDPECEVFGCRIHGKTEPETR